MEDISNLKKCMSFMQRYAPDPEYYVITLKTNINTSIYLSVWVALGGDNNEPSSYISLLSSMETDAIRDGGLEICYGVILCFHSRGLWRLW